jgi:TFIIF-interacting CTD phosphatase-like protein
MKPRAKHVVVRQQLGLAAAAATRKNRANGSRRPKVTKRKDSSNHDCEGCDVIQLMIDSGKQCPTASQRVLSEIAPNQTESASSSSSSSIMTASSPLNNGSSRNNHTDICDRLLCHDDVSSEILALIRSLPAAPLAIVPAIPPKVSGDQRKYTLVLDIDETLVHCTTNRMDDAEFVLDVSGTDIYVRTRPNLDKFLKEAAR